MDDPNSTDRPTLGRATINDVARRANVSIGTVSRVLNNVRNVRAPLRDRVLKAVEELNYQPDFVAQSMRSKQTRVIGVVLPEFRNPLAAAVAFGVEQELASSGYTIFLANSRYDRAREERILDEFQRRRVDGIIAMIAYDEDPETIAQLKQLKVPLVLIEREMDLDADSVRTNQIDGAYRATRYLIGLGHTRIGFVSVPFTNLSGRHRFRGFEKAFQDTKHELPQDLVRSGGYQHDYSLEAAYSILTSEKPPTAILVSGGLLSGVLEASRMLHLSIPEELSIVCLGDTELAALTVPAITSVRYDWAETGHVAARLIVARIAGDQTERVRKVVVPYEFLIRQSCMLPQR
jgi:LacI family transcriptional regulator